MQRRAVAARALADMEEELAVLARALCTGGLDPRDPKTAPFCISFLRKGEVLAYVGLPQNLKDLKKAAPDAHGAVVQAFPVG